MEKDGSEALGANEQDGIVNAISRKEDNLETALERKRQIMTQRGGFDPDAEGAMDLRRETSAMRNQL